ncbi:DegV family protein [Corynebacterium heidelbergense]|uniref:EDD domain protein n=1 Tax=Corynebacterium heidelbergense TaxID=2055947 RepID=A0A364VAM1_9CORY|nr:DegV family protein [Corynebacterium heidelbergense]RAV33695.1 EDD domain protein [Corynebacterium heidelbergense]WCZ36224.1 DegV domain-containing protein [Corynebacterium heidelbergense]
MTVHVVTDSSSCLPAEAAQRAGVTVLPLHTSGEDEERSTAGLGSLELAAAYARLLERGGDEGVVAIHVSKELSATWSNAVTAAGVFDHTVKVLDTQSAGMVLGFAAVRAGEVAQAGGDLEEVEAAARAVIHSGNTWLYVHKLEALRRGGRLSTGQRLLSTALAIKPILHLGEGRLDLAAKTRTRAKAFDKLVDMVRTVVVGEAEHAASVGESPRVVLVAIHDSEAVEAADALRDRMVDMIAAVREEAAGGGARRDGGGKKDEGAGLSSELPRVEFMRVKLSAAVAVHTGPGAVAVSTALVPAE